MGLSYDSSSQASEDVTMTTENDVSYDVTSTNLHTECPHCEFRCSSPTVMTQHSWEVHPLLMRRKKHLITSRKTDDVKTESEKPSDGYPTADSGGSSSPRLSPIHSHLDMQKCSLKTPEETNVIEPTTSQHIVPPVPMQNQMNDNKRSPSAEATSTPQRHIAIVKPVPNEHQMATAQSPITMDPTYLSRFHAMQHNLQQQSLKFLAQPMIQNQLVYAPMFNVLVPGLNQYVTIPVPVAGAIPQTKFPSGIFNQDTRTSQHIPAQNQYVNAHAFNQTQQQQQTIPVNNGNADFVKYETFQQKHLGSTARSNPQLQNVSEVKPFHHILPKPTWQTKDVKLQIPSSNAPYSGSIKTLLQSNIGNHVPSNENIQMYNSAKNEVCTEKDAFPYGKNTRLPPPPSTPQMGSEKLKALENAMRSTDYCDINDNSTTMPFQCPDGVWRMVTFKCIRGVWLVQIPGSSTPTVYVPCDVTKNPDHLRVKLQANGKKVSRDENTLVGMKRKSSDSIQRKLRVIDAKRLCASAPVPGLRTEVPRRKPTVMKRTLSSPSVANILPTPKQHFTNNEGKKMNISMFKRAPAIPTASGSLIRSLLLRKPVAHGTIGTSKRLLPGNRACVPASERLSNLNPSSVIPKDSLAY